MHNFARKQSLIANWLSQFTPTGKFWVRSNISLLPFYKNKLYCKVSNQNRITCHFSERGRTSVFPFFGQFLPFYPICGQKSQFSNNEKKHLEILTFCICVAKITIITAVVTCIVCGRTFS